MVRLYRIAHDAGTLHAAEREGRFRLVDGDIFASFHEGPEIVADTARWLAPVRPSKIIGVGLNYRDRAAELEEALPDEPRLILKPPTAVVGPNAAIEVPTWAGRVDYEASVGVVIGRTARHVPARRAYDYVLGLTAVNDVTARDLARRGSAAIYFAKAADTQPTILFAVEQDYRPWHMQRKFSREARGLGPYQPRRPYQRREGRERSR